MPEKPRTASLTWTAHALFHSTSTIDNVFKQPFPEEVGYHIHADRISQT